MSLNILVFFRLPLRQGDIPSIFWLWFNPMKPNKQVFKAKDKADDVKPAITCMEEFYLVDRALKRLLVTLVLVKLSF